MGMSASQARFLCLTARKSNVEFSGQQINQQRTTLSNESSSYYSELCNMTVPTPPSIDDYTKVSYTFNDGALTNTITSLIAKGNGQYSISYIQQWQDDYSVVAAASSVVNKRNDDYYVGTTQLRILGSDSQTIVKPTFYKDNVAYPVIKLHSGDNVNIQEHDDIYDINELKGITIDEDSAGYYYKRTVTVQNLEEIVNPARANIQYAIKVFDNKIDDARSSVISEYDNNEKLLEFEWELTPEFDENNNLTGYFVKSLDKMNPQYDGEENFIVYAVKPLAKEYDDDGNIIGYKDLNGKSLTPQEYDDSGNIISCTEYKIKNSLQDVYEKLSQEELSSITEQEEIDQDVIALEKEYKALLNKKYNDGADKDWYVRYTTDSSTGAHVPYFYEKDEVVNAHYDENSYALNSIRCFSSGSTTETREILNKTGTVTKDSAGRYISITIFEEDPNPEVDEDGNPIKKTTQITYDLTTNTVTDEEAYNDAMNKYNYEQHQYDKKIQDINSKLEIVQQQDKSLELNLKQLDTEENAIVTEMEAVKKVISKNVEQSFKTFEA